WEILTGRPLHAGLGGEALLDIKRSGNFEPPSSYAPGTPVELEAIVMKAMAADAGERFRTARELSAAIGRALIARQELIDASTLEATISELAPRGSRTGNSDPPGGGGSLESLLAASRAFDARTQAAVPLARSSIGGTESVRSVQVAQALPSEGRVAAGTP